MKKILIVGAPDKCPNCLFCYADPSWLNADLFEEIKFCAATKEYRELTEYGKEDSPDWCPLKELPEHKPDDQIKEEQIAEREHVPIDWFQAYCTGWNACLDIIAGMED